MRAGPLVSVIIPVRDEAAHIEETLRSVLAQDHPRDRLEVLVVDGMSEDDTKKIVESVGDPRVRLLDNPRRVMPAGVNVGLTHATGEVVAIVGGHCELDGDYLTNAIEVLRATGADAAGGPIETVGTTPVGSAIAAASASRLGVGNTYFRISSPEPRWVDTLGFPVYRRDVFDRVGTFDESIVRHQDYEFNLRLRRAGGRIRYDPSIRARYMARSSYGAMVKQFFQYGTWKGYLSRSQPAMMRSRHLAPPVMVAGFAGLSIALPFTALAATGLALAGVSYATLCVVGSVAIGRKRGLRTALLALPVFPLIHLSWGTGWWKGLIIGEPAQRGSTPAQRDRVPDGPADDR